MDRTACFAETTIYSLDTTVQPINPFTPTSDQDRISPYNINTISSRQGDENREEYQSWDY